MEWNEKQQKCHIRQKESTDFLEFYKLFDVGLPNF